VEAGVLGIEDDTESGRAVNDFPVRTVNRRGALLFCLAAAHRAERNLVSLPQLLLEGWILGAGGKTAGWRIGLRSQATRTQQSQKRKEDASTHRLFLRVR